MPDVRAHHALRRGADAPRRAHRASLDATLERRALRDASARVRRRAPGHRRDVRRGPESARRSARRLGGRVRSAARLPGEEPHVRERATTRIAATQREPEPGGGADGRRRRRGALRERAPGRASRTRSTSRSSRAAAPGARLLPSLVRRGRHGLHLRRGHGVLPRHRDPLARRPRGVVRARAQHARREPPRLRVRALPLHARRHAQRARGRLQARAPVEPLARGASGKVGDPATRAIGAHIDRARPWADWSIGHAALPRRCNTIPTTWAARDPAAPARRIATATTASTATAMRHSTLALARRLPRALASRSRRGRAARSPSPAPSGWAATTPGGRGGKIIRVTDLDADGPGSFKAAVEAKGPRIVVFEVGGVIDLGRKELDIREPFLTIAGQTAPSPGITLIRGGLNVHAHDVIIRHIRVRTGADGQAKRSGWEADALQHRRRAPRDRRPLHLHLGDRREHVRLGPALQGRQRRGVARRHLARHHLLVQPRRRGPRRLEPSQGRALEGLAGPRQRDRHPHLPQRLRAQRRAQPAASRAACTARS